MGWCLKLGLWLSPRVKVRATRVSRAWRMSAMVVFGRPGDQVSGKQCPTFAEERRSVESDKRRSSSLCNYTESARATMRAAARAGQSSIIHTDTRCSLGGLTPRHAPADHRRAARIARDLLSLYARPIRSTATT